MTYSIDSKNIQGVLNLVVNIEGEEELLIPTKLDKQGMDLLMEDIVEFIEDAMWDITDMVIKESDEEQPLGIIIDLYKDDDDDPITTCLWYEDYLPIDDDNEDDDKPRVLKMKD
jgi:hypothetical protein